MHCVYSVYYRFGKNRRNSDFDNPKQVAVFIDGMKKEFGSRFEYRVFYEEIYDNIIAYRFPLRYYPSKRCFIDHLNTVKIYY